MTKLRLATFALVVAAVSAHAQGPMPPAAAKPCPSAPMMDHGTPGTPGAALASPAMTAETTLAGKALSIRYNAPSMRCRTIMGDVVPYGKVWRTGANSATTLVTAGDIEVGELKLAAGTYTLYTLPAAPGTPWMLIINKQTGQWGTVYKMDQDLGRVTMKSKMLPAAQEMMSISFEHVKGKKAELHVRWEKTDEWVEVEAK